MFSLIIFGLQYTCIIHIHMLITVGFPSLFTYFVSVWALLKSLRSLLFTPYVISQVHTR